jgi:hypothetical protein
VRADPARAGRVSVVGGDERRARQPYRLQWCTATSRPTASFRVARALIDAVLERPPIGPAAIRLLEHTLEQFGRHSASGQQAKLEAVGVLSGMIQTYLRNERPSGGVLDVEFIGARQEMFVRLAAAGTHPRLAAVLAQTSATGTESPDAQLARVLGLILDGLLPDK